MLTGVRARYFQWALMLLAVVCSIGVGNLLSSASGWNSSLSWIGIGGLGVVALAFLVAKPWVAVALYAIVYPAIPPAEGMSSAKLLAFALLVMPVAIWVSRIAIQRKQVLRDPLTRGSVLCLTYLCLSPVIGASYNLTLLGWARDVDDLLPFLFIPFLRDLMRTPRERHIVLGALLFVIIAGSARDLVNMARHWGALEAMNLNSVVLFGLHCWHWVFLLAAGLALWQMGDRPLRLCGGLVILLGGALVTLTPTRTVWIGTVVVIVFYFLPKAGTILSFRRGPVAAVTFGVAFVVIMGIRGFFPSQDFWNSHLKRVRSPLTSDFAVRDRMAELHEAMRTFADSPILGAGYGYEYHFFRLFSRQIGGSGMLVTDFVHNDLVNILAKGGLVAFVLLSRFVFIVWRQFVQRSRNCSGRLEQFLASALAPGLMAALVMSFSTPILQSRYATHTIGLLLAIFLCGGSDSSEGSRK